MALEMRIECERCGNPLEPDGPARIWSYECHVLRRVCRLDGERVPELRRRARHAAAAHADVTLTG